MLEDIVNLQLEKVEQRLGEQKISLKISDDAKKLLTKEGYDPAFGARPMRRVIQDKVEAQIAKDLLEGKIKKGEVVEVKI